MLHLSITSWSLIIISMVLGYVNSQTCITGTCNTEPCSEASRPCLLPSDDPNMRFCPVGCAECLESGGGHCRTAPGSPVSHHTRVQCGPGHRLHTDQDYDLLACDNGTWIGEFPRCLAQCPPLVSESVFPKCLSGAREVDCSKPMMPKATATVQCRPSHTEYPNLVEAGLYKRTISCRFNGQWSHNLPECKPVCGVSKGSAVVTATVVDGQDTPLGVFPWHAALYQREHRTRWKYICGGSLITTRVVMTAAHCVILDKNDLQMAFAKYFRVWSEDEPYTVKRKVSAISLPREFDWAVNTLAWDIALVFLDQPIQVNSYIMPVCRSPSLNFAHDISPTGYVVGWGKTETGNNSEVLQHNDITIMPHDICNRKIPRALAVDKFCGSKNSASVVEKGDSGGGLTAMYNNQHHLVGIVSIKYGDVSVFTNVSWSPHITWVENQIINFDEEITRCSGYTFQCGLYGACLEKSVRCNGRRDCPDGSDEFGCPAITTGGHRPDDDLDLDTKCTLPTQPTNGRYQSLHCAPGDRRTACLDTPGAPVPAFWLLEYSCHDGYAANGTRSTRSSCEAGQWSNPLECVMQCPGLDAAFTDLSCEYAGVGVSCREAARAGTVAVATCKAGHRRPSGGDAPVRLQCLPTGGWSQTVENCTPDPDPVYDENTNGTKNHTGEINPKNCYLGDICKVGGSFVWTCQFLRDCPEAIALLKSGDKPQMCNFDGSSVEPVVCCQSSHSTTTRRPEPEGGTYPAPPPYDATARPSAATLPPPARPATPVQPQTVGAISKKMCNEYAKHVFLRVPNPELPDEIIKFDTCSAVNAKILIPRPEAREFPHMALIGFGNKDSIEWLCGGSLISEKFVLAASHCANGAGRNGPARWVRLGVRLGEYNFGSDKDEEMGLSQPVDYEVSEAIVHPEFRPPSVYNDIALIKLSKDVEFNEFIRPACLHTEEELTTTYAVYTSWSQGDTGYGIRKVNLTIIPHKECAIEINSLKNIRLKDGVLDSKMICASDIHNRKDTCQGDAGGPLQLKLDDPYCMYSVVGVASFGASRCGAETVPDVFTRVSYYVPWIELVVWPTPVSK